MTMSATMHSHREDAGRVLVVAAAQRLDDTLVADDGFAGLAVKQVYPPADTAKADLRKILSGERYLILDSGECDTVVPAGLGFTPVKSTALWIDPATGTIYNTGGSGTAAFLVTGTVGANNAIRWTARDPDRLPIVRLVDPGAASQALSVDTDGLDVIVTLATSAGSAITSTATLVIAAVLEHDAASGLVAAANEGASTGAGVVAAVAATPLAGAAASTRLKLGKVRYMGPDPARGLPADMWTVGLDARKDF